MFTYEIGTRHYPSIQGPEVTIYRHDKSRHIYAIWIGCNWDRIGTCNEVIEFEGRPPEYRQCVLIALDELKERGLFPM